MNEDRRLFINRMALATAFAVLSKPLRIAAAISKPSIGLHPLTTSVPVFYTNDLYGSIAPVQDNLGGLNHVRSLLRHHKVKGLILDGGDFTNTLYNTRQQMQVVEVMNNIGYYAAAVGPNELALDQENLVKLAARMNFTLVNCNYKFDGNLAAIVKPYAVIQWGQYKVGVTAVGPQLKNVRYTDAIESANKHAAILKGKEKCDLVICLSQLENNCTDNRPDNQKLAALSQDIDMIVCSHKGAILGNMIVHNQKNNEVVVSHTVCKGLLMGKTTFTYSNKQRSGFSAEQFVPGQPAGDILNRTFTKLHAKREQLEA